MSKPLMVHVITNFAGVGGAEMMLVRLIQQTEHDYQHVIIALMKTSEVYQSTLECCQSHYALGWNGLNTLSTVSKLRALLKKLQAATVQCWICQCIDQSQCYWFGEKTKGRMGHSSFSCFS